MLSGQIIILANLGIIEGSAIGAAALVMIALLLIILSIAVCAARWRSKRSSLNRSNISVSEVGSRNEQLLTSTEVSYDYVRGSPFFQDTDGLITKKNSAYESTHIEMSPNIAYRNKKAVHYHHPLTESLLHNNEYAYISQPA